MTVVTGISIYNSAPDKITFRVTTQHLESRGGALWPVGGQVDRYAELIVNGLDEAPDQHFNLTDSG